MSEEWIDEVLVVVSEVLPYPTELIEQLSETGVTIHQSCKDYRVCQGKKQFVEKVGDYSPYDKYQLCINQTVNVKTAMDIAGELVGCILPESFVFLSDRQFILHHRDQFSLLRNE